MAAGSVPRSCLPAVPYPSTKGFVPDDMTERETFKDVPHRNRRVSGYRLGKRWSAWSSGVHRPEGWVDAPLGLALGVFARTRVP